MIKSFFVMGKKGGICEVGVSCVIVENTKID